MRLPLHVTFDHAWKARRIDSRARSLSSFSLPPAWKRYVSGSARQLSGGPLLGQPLSSFSQVSVAGSHAVERQ